MWCAVVLSAVPRAAHHHQARSRRGRGVLVHLTVLVPNAVAAKKLQAGVRYAQLNPFSYVHANLAGEVALLEVMKAQKTLPALVYASSSSVYGLNDASKPFSEDDRVDLPTSLYAATKRVGTLALLEPWMLLPLLLAWPCCSYCCLPDQQRQPGAVSFAWHACRPTS